jgi:hypothetical protein
LLPPPITVHNEAALRAAGEARPDSAATAAFAVRFRCDLSASC